MNGLIDAALQELRQIEASDDPTDNAPFINVRGDNARLLELDPSIHHSTVNTQKLLKNDGSIVTQIVEIVRICQPGDAEDNVSINDSTRFGTVKYFLRAIGIL